MNPSCLEGDWSTLQKWMMHIRNNELIIYVYTDVLLSTWSCDHGNKKHGHDMFLQYVVVFNEGCQLFKVLRPCEGRASADVYVVPEWLVWTQHEIQVMGCKETIIPHTLLSTAVIPDLEMIKSNSIHGHTVKVVLISKVQVTCFPQPAALKTPPVKIKIKQRTPEAHYDAKEWSCTTIRSNAWTMCEMAPSELSLLFSRVEFFFNLAPDNTLVSLSRQHSRGSALLRCKITPFIKVLIKYWLSVQCDVTYNLENPTKTHRKGSFKMSCHPELSVTSRTTGAKV